MLWATLILNLMTIVIAIRKRMILYALFNAIFLFLVIGQGFQIASDLDQRHSVQYLFNYINDVGFALAVRYVFGCTLLSFFIAITARSFDREKAAASAMRFEPTVSFYYSLMVFLLIVTVVLIFAVVGLDNFLHSSRPGYQSGATIFIVLLVVGMFPLLLKVLCQTKVRLADVVCAVYASAVTAAFSRIHIFFYLTALLLALYYAAGWYKRPVSASMVLRFGLIGIAGFGVFFGIGALHDAQNFTGGNGGSLSDLIGYIADHPERSLLSISYNYRVGIEGMSGIAGAFTQSLGAPDYVRHDYGVSSVLQAVVLTSPSIIKTYLTGLTQLSDDFNWYAFSIVPTGAETFFVSFGWLAVLLYPFAVYLLGWFLPRRIFAREGSPLQRLTATTFLACCIFFVRGSLPTWIAFSVSYFVVIAFSWPLLRRHLRRS